MDEERKTVTIYSYKKVWNVEKKIYSISNISLPVPVNPYDMLVFLGTALFMLLLGKMIPVTAGIPTVLRFIAIPYGVAQCLMKMKFDGKNPIKYLFGYLGYLLTEKGKFYHLFRSYPAGKQKVPINWVCSMGSEK